MAKNKKGFSEYKKYKMVQQYESPDLKDVQFEPNIQEMARDFSKLLHKKYCFILSDGKYMEFQMKSENFYHLLGFNRFKNMIYDKMIEDQTVDYWKSNFYNDVLNGYITYDGYDSTKVIVPNEIRINSNISFAEHEEVPKVKEAKLKRFPYFTYDKVIELLKSKVIIDYEKDENDSLINAEKIFFKFMDEWQKNLNLFIGYNLEDGDFYPSTFFLENKKDNFKYKKDGSLMKNLDIICLYIEDISNYKKVEFSVDWELVEKCIEKVACLETYKNLKKYYSTSEITVPKLILELEEIKKIHSTKIEEIGIISKDEYIIELKLKYFTSTSLKDKENYVLELMNYDIDIENKKMSIEDLKREQGDILSSKKMKKESIARLKNKIEKIESAIPIINDLAIYKVKQVYGYLISKSDTWNNEFWIYLINEKKCFEYNIAPREVKKIYTEWIK